MDPKTNWSIHTPHWHPDERTPVVDGKYYDKKTGELLVAADDSGYLGPPAVDIIISNLNYDTGLYVSRWARQFPVEQLLWQIMKVVKANELQIASVNATLYSINIMLTAEATKEQMNGLSDRMANGIWEPEKEDAKIRQLLDKSRPAEEDKAEDSSPSTKHEEAT